MVALSWHNGTPNIREGEVPCPDIAGRLDRDNRPTVPLQEEGYEAGNAPFHGEQDVYDAKGERRGGTNCHQ